jgi:alpha,alpha-trehalose phosphorylase
MRDHGGVLSFAPRLPQALARVAFRLTFRGRLLKVEFDHARVVYSLLRGDAVEIQHAGEPVMVEPAHPVTRPVTMPPARQRPAQPAGREPARRGEIREPV